MGFGRKLVIVCGIVGAIVVINGVVIIGTMFTTGADVSIVEEVVVKLMFLLLRSKGVFSLTVVDVGIMVDGVIIIVSLTGAGATCAVCIVGVIACGRR